MKYNTLLNNKSILFCELEKEIAQHEQENMKIFDLIQEKAEAGAVLKISYSDPGHWDSKPEYKYVAAEDYLKVLDAFDVKNGVNFAERDGHISAEVFGQNYNLYNQEYMITAHIDFRFIDGKQTDSIRTFNECLDFLENNELKQEFLGIVHKKNDFFVDSGALIKELKLELNPSLELMINKAKIKREPARNQNQQGLDVPEH